MGVSLLNLHCAKGWITFNFGLRRKYFAYRNTKEPTLTDPTFTPFWVEEYHRTNNKVYLLHPMAVPAE